MLWCYPFLLQGRNELNDRTIKPEKKRRGGLRHAIDWIKLKPTSLTPLSASDVNSVQDIFTWEWFRSFSLSLLLFSSHHRASEPQNSNKGELFLFFWGRLGWVPNLRVPLWSNRIVERDGLISFSSLSNNNRIRTSRKILMLLNTQAEMGNGRDLNGARKILPNFHLFFILFFPELVAL